MDVTAEADKAYWNYIAVRQKVRMLEAYQIQMDTLYRQVETAVKAGMGTDNELLRINAKRSEISYQLQKARNGADLCRMALCHTLGEPFDTQPIPVDTLIQVTAPARLDESIALRPELKLLEQQIAARQQQIKWYVETFYRKSDFLPDMRTMETSN